MGAEDGGVIGQRWREPFEWKGSLRAQVLDGHADTLGSLGVAGEAVFQAARVSDDFHKFTIYGLCAAGGEVSRACFGL